MAGDEDFTVTSLGACGKCGVDFAVTSWDVISGGAVAPSLKDWEYSGQWLCHSDFISCSQDWLVKRASLGCLWEMSALNSPKLSAPHITEDDIGFYSGFLIWEIHARREFGSSCILFMWPATSYPKCHACSCKVYYIKLCIVCPGEKKTLGLHPLDNDSFRFFKKNICWS